MRLPSGGIVNSSLFSLEHGSMDKAFQQQSNNVQMRVGFVEARYPIDSPKNISKKHVEYDVNTIHQTDGGGITNVVYRNCGVSDGFGGIGDFFEKTLRPQTKSDTKNNPEDLINQDGAIVIVQCVNGNLKNATIVGAMPHPELKSRLSGNGNELAAEFNGVGIKINDDGSCSLTFKGATDNSGQPIDDTQGTTTVSIEKDGSIQIENAGVSQRLDKTTGDWTITNTGASEISSQKDVAISANGGANSITASESGLSVQIEKDVDLQAKSVSIKSSGGSASLGDDLAVEAKSATLKAAGQVKVEAAQVTLDAITTIGGPSGIPAPMITTMYMGLGNLGLPVISFAIGPFATKTYIN